MLQLRPDFRSENLARRKIVRLGKSLQRFFDIVAEPPIDLARRKPRAVEQHLQLDGERADAVFRRKFSGEIGAVDPLRREFSPDCRMNQAGEYQWHGLRSDRQLPLVILDCELPGILIPHHLQLAFFQDFSILAAKNGQ